MITRFAVGIVRPVTLVLLPALWLLLGRASLAGMPDEKATGPVTNVRVIPETSVIVVVYDLIDREEKGWTIGVELIRSSDPSFKYVPRDLKGAVGELRGSHKDLRIVWDYSKEMAAPPGDDFRIVVTYTPLGGGFPWLWVGLGTAVVGGAVAWLICKNCSDNDEDLPWPPARPAAR